MDEQDQQRVAVAEGGSAKHWGFWRTAGWGLVAFAAFLGTQVVLFALLGVEDQLANGLYLSVATILGGLAGMAALWAVVRRKFDVYDYLSLRLPGVRTLVLWILAGAGFWIAFSVLAFLLDRSTPQFMADVYNTAGSPALLFLAVVIIAPLFEETLFRGLLFRGWSPSPLRVWGTIALTAALWTVLHSQYGAFEIGGLFLYGILLGTARHLTGTLIVPVVLHALSNAWAFAQTAFSATA